LGKAFILVVKISDPSDQDMKQKGTDDTLGIRKMTEVGLRVVEVRLYNLITEKSDRLRQLPEILTGLEEAYRDLVDFNQSFAARQMNTTRALIYLNGIAPMVNRVESLLEKKGVSEYLNRIFKVLSPRLSIQLPITMLGCLPKRFDVALGLTLFSYLFF
jgi:hypothetical protein